MPSCAMRSGGDVIALVLRPPVFDLYGPAIELRRCEVMVQKICWVRTASLTRTHG